MKRLRLLLVPFIAMGAIVGAQLAIAGTSVPPVAKVALAVSNPISPLGMVGTCLGTPTLLGTIDFTAASKTNASATTPFNNTGDGLAGKCLLLQPTQPVYIVPGTSSATTASSTTAVLIKADERVCFCMHTNYSHLAAIAYSTGGNLFVWNMI